MIAFSKLGSFGRLGNQLFQYAFLRSTAQRLNTTFYCPSWEGDNFFDLADSDERVEVPSGLKYSYRQGPQAGYVEEAMKIGDCTDIEGYFQSELFYEHPDKVRGWYSFKDQIRKRVWTLYDRAQANESVSISLRIDSDYNNTREFFPLYPLKYYKRAVTSLDLSSHPILVFSDRPDLARTFLRNWPGVEMRFVNELSAYEQLYLMTQCRANVITNSTFAWWGAWLNRNESHQVVAPSHWCRPGVPNAINSIICKNWIRVPGTIPIWDHFQMWRLRHPIATLQRLMKRSK